MSGRFITTLPERDRTAALFLHLSPLLIVLLGLLPGLGNILGPWAAWMLVRRQSPVLDQQGKEVLNFQLSLLIYSLAFGLLTFLLGTLGFLGVMSGAVLNSQWLAQFSLLSSLGSFVLVLIPALVLLYIVPFVAMLIAVIQVSQGRAYRYPLTLRIIR